MRVLVVDDLPTNRKLMRISLEPEGHTVVEAADGIEALELLESQPFDAVISDILMPRMDGYRLCFEVRKHPRLKQLAFIISSSTYTSPADAKLALEVGADRYFKKPAPARDVLAALHELWASESRKPRSFAITEEGLVMKEYSEVLVRKLEEKNSELEKTQAELLRVNRALEARVEERTAELTQANADLEAFNSSVSHDLRGPITEIQGYAQILQRSTGDQFDTMGRQSAGKILHAAHRMEGLIREFLKLAQVKQAQLRRQKVDLSKIAVEITDRLRASQPDRSVDFIIVQDLKVQADLPLLHSVLDNLLGNAWKFTAKCPQARIEFGIKTPHYHAPDSNTPTLQHSTTPIFFVRDNGAGFDMNQADRMFRPFERLHIKSDFPGTGIGLTIVQRIITRHGGRIWAEAEPGKGATFFFTLAP